MFDTCVPFLSAFEKIAPPIVGQSLVTVGRKQG
jgi:hypothetical protein